MQKYNVEYKLKRCSKKEYMKQCRVSWKKWPVQNPTHKTTHKHVEHHDATDIWKKTNLFVFIGFFWFFYFFNKWLSLEVFM